MRQRRHAAFFLRVRMLLPISPRTAEGSVREPSPSPQRLLFSFDFFPMIAGLICRPLLFSSQRFSWSASVGSDSSRYSLTASNDACFFWVATCRHIYQQLLPIFSYIAACASGPSPASKLSSRPLLFFRALRPPPAQRCVDTFSARSLSLPMFINVQNN